MGFIPHSQNRCAVYHHGDGKRINGCIVGNLIIGSLQEGGGSEKHRLCAILCSTTGKGYSCLLRNPHIHKLLSCLFPLLCMKSHAAGHSCGNSQDCRILLHFRQQKFRGKFSDILPGKIVFFSGFSRFQMEGQMPVPAFLILLRKLKPLTLCGMNVKHHGFFVALRLFQGFYQRLHIISLFLIEIFQPHSPEQIVLSLAIAFSKAFQALIHAPVVFRNGHFIII